MIQLTPERTKLTKIQLELYLPNEDILGGPREIEILEGGKERPEHINLVPGLNIVRVFQANSDMTFLSIVLEGPLIQTTYNVWDRRRLLAVLHNLKLVSNDLLAS